MKKSKHLFLALIKSLCLVFWMSFIAACQEAEEPEPPEEVVEEPVQIYKLDEGDFLGVWNSRTSTVSFNGIAITARINIQGDTAVMGDLFISSNFTSCCGSENSDGPISFKVKDNAIQNFVWEDVIPNCEGTFSGSGRLRGDNNLEVTFTGTDCDGNHTGSLTLALIE